MGLLNGALIAVSMAARITFLPPPAGTTPVVSATPHTKLCLFTMGCGRLVGIIDIGESSRNRHGRGSESDWCLKKNGE